MDIPYTETPEHRAGVYCMQAVPAMREWAKRDFLDWLARRDAQIRAEAWDEGALWAAVECRAIDDEGEPWLAPGDNPYRLEQS